MMSPSGAGAGAPRSRPDVDVIVPFAGSEAALMRLIANLEAIELGDGDTLTIVDNRTDVDASAAPAVARGTVLAARRRGSSYYARNRGAEAGSAEWIVFIDADTEPAPDLLDRYFDHAPADEVGLIGGGIVDVGPEPGGRPSPARVFAEHGRILDQSNTIQEEGPWWFAKTANCAVRRIAFEQLGGFCDHVRSGADADLCFRLRSAGWRIEYRESARVLHHGRTALRDLLRQYARWGSGGAWLNRRYPGSNPPKRLDLVSLTARRLGGALVAGLRRDRDGVYIRLVDLAAIWALEVGRQFSNEVR